MPRILATAFLCLVFGVALAQVKVPIYVDDTINANDNDGRRLVFELKEAIRGSHGYSLVAGNSWPHLKVSIVTVPSVVGGQVKGTAYSYTQVYDDIGVPLLGAYLTSGVGICPSDGLGNCARSLLAGIEETVGTLRRRNEGFWKSLHKQ